MHFHRVRHATLPQIVSLTALAYLLAAVPAALAAAERKSPAKSAESQAAVESLESFLTKSNAWGEPLAEKSFARVPLTKADAARAKQLLWQRHAQRIAKEREEEVSKGVLELGKHKMPFFLTTYGKEPKEGWSLWISMHGGGNAPKYVNDQQWENQKRLYRLEEGIYVAPRAPTNTWNLWHEPHIDALFDRLIEDLVVLKHVNPNRVYIMGYSAGGDGVYQLAPRMADRWAAAAMMAGHPNDASWLGLRNVGFAIQVGELDSGYNRNKVARQWIDKLDELRRQDPTGYLHFGKLHEGKSHWMDREDAKVLPWMAAIVRNPVPDRVVWKQSQITHDRLYWLALPKDVPPAGDALVDAERAGQTITIKAAEKVDRLLVRLDDRMLDLDQPVRIVYQENVLFEGCVPRTVAALIHTLVPRGDPDLVFAAEVEVKLPPAKPSSAEDWAKMKLITPRGYVCGYASQPPAIDGRLDDPAWQAAPWTEDFLDIEGPSKPKPRFRTRAKMLWDKDYFYIAAELQEPHVQATITKHDAVIFQDNDFEVFINPDGDNHNYYELELNALNTTWDLYLAKPYKDGGKADDSFEYTGMKTAVHVKGTLNEPSDKDGGWCVEIAIPWKALAQHAHRPCPPRDGDQWRIDFSRVEWKFDIVNGKYVKVPNLREDNWIWSPPGIVDMHRPERWGYVQFSKEPPGKAKFAPDPTLPGRDRLMEVYHRQKSFHEEHGRWAKTLQELGIEQAVSKQFPKPLELKVTKDGFEATLEMAIPGQPARRLRVRQDSRLTCFPIDDPVQNALDKAGANREQIQKALDDASADERAAMEFLVANMPGRDLRELSAEFLLENVRLARQAWNESPWKCDVPQDVFLNDVLPYANLDERRDRWRKDFHDQFRPLIKQARTPGEAAVLLNQKVFPLLKVHYSTKRPKAVQSPYESTQAGIASCSGLAILLVDACRSVGVPARFVGTLWTDGSGNHSWTEVWDHGWHYTGAAEPAGDKLDKAWFTARAATARRDDLWHAIYAVSYRRTPVRFPLVWDPNIEVYAVNITDRYKSEGPKIPPGTIPMMFRVMDAPGGDRCAASLTIFDAAGKVVFEGTTNDERFDANDHLVVYLPLEKEYRAEISCGKRTIKAAFRAERRDAPYTWYLDKAAEK